MNTNIRNTIIRLIDLKQEGPYWDFKRQWYSEKKKGDLLVDIIAMANNLSDHDGYIIIGVDEERDYEITSVENDENRKNTDSIVDFLRDKRFAGGIRPSVFVEPIELEQGTIDVIVVRNTTNTPYYLSEHFHNVREGNIYARIETSNTPVDRTADDKVVERLWRKRFRLGEEPLQSVKRFLENNKNWIDSPVAGNMLQYFKYHPEYTLEMEKDDRNGIEFYMLGTYVMELHPQWWMITLRYHQTILDQVLMLGLDGSRCIVAAPDHEYVHYSHNKWLFINCYVHDSITYKVHLHYCDLNDQCVWSAYDNFMRCIVEFENDDEKDQFVQYMEDHEREYDEYMLREYDLPSTYGLPKEYSKDNLLLQYKQALAVKDMFNNWYINSHSM